MMKTGSMRSSVLKPAGRFGRAGTRALLDLLLPPRCLSCAAVTDNPGGLCGTCWAQMPFLEPPWCQRYGSPFTHDIGPDALSPRAIADPPLFDRARAAALYTGPARDLILKLKFSGRRDLVRPMGRWMARAGFEFLNEESLIVPVPLHRLRLWQRRFNQAAELGRSVASFSGATFVPDLLRRTRRTQQQVGLDKEARKRNVRGAFEVRPGKEAAVHGQNVVLIDDVMTTGSTVAACTRVLRSAGAQRVDVLTFAIAGPDGELT
jgi:ComF family protein